jgi:Flp pilus assembly protein TadB
MSRFFIEFLISLFSNLCFGLFGVQAFWVLILPLLYIPYHKMYRQRRLSKMETSLPDISQFIQIDEGA